MKNLMICAVLAAAILASCSGNGDGGDDSVISTKEPVTAGISDDATTDPDSTDDVTTDTPVSPGNDEGTESENETIPPIPEIPEGGVTGMTGALMFTNEDIVIHDGGSGTKYVNGEPFPNDVVSSMLYQAMNPDSTSSKETSKTITTIPDPNGSSAVTTTKGVIHIPVEPDIPDLPVLSENNTVAEGEDVFYLGKYVKTADAGLGITAINVFSSAKPGVKGVDAFRPGDTMLINVDCDTVAALDGTMYIVREQIDHKDSYLDIEVLDTVKLSEGFDSGNGRFFVEYTVPQSIDSAVYELRFCLNGEEGYIPFYLG